MRYTYTLILFLSVLFVPSVASARWDVAMPEVFNEVDTFPVPKGIKEMLFYVQRTPNTNTIVYELNRGKDGKLNAEEPIHIFWLRYQEDGKRKELNFIQRKFAYGLKVKKQKEDAYDLRFVSYDKHPLFLRKATDNNYYIYSTIQNKQAILKRIYIKIDGGTFWHPNVLYIELSGVEASTGKEISERFKP
ncbi:MAG: DUF4833 domain-containing protein [Sphingobacteriales bacterium]|nr:MAG: DUF4833 domain-containing protein [Sphingobacteriales bacterium]